MMYLLSSRSRLDDSRFILFTPDLDARKGAHLVLRDLLTRFRLTCPKLIVYCPHLQLQSLITRLAGI